MQSFFSCFSCGEKSSAVVTPQPIPISSSKITITSDNYSKNNASIINSIDDQKSKTATTITFRTTDTAMSKISTNEDEYIKNKIEQLKSKDLAEKKAIQQQFVKQNLSKSQIVYLVEKQWSQQYTKYLKDPKLKSIRTINNKNLLDSNGKLKENLKQRQDYFIINSRIWKLVKLLYGGGPEIEKDYMFPVYSLAYKKLQIPTFGIKNPLNLCFMISIIQSLLSIQQLNYYFSKRQFVDSENTSKKKIPYHNVLYKFIRQCIDDNNSTNKTYDIKQLASLLQLKFNPYQQHDAQELFIHLSNMLQEQMKIEVNQPRSFKDADSAYYHYMTTNRSIIDKVFAGQITSTVTCNKCDEDSHTYLPFIDICLEISDNTLEKCLEKHFSEQRLDDLYQCQKCKKKSKAVKKLTLTKCPNYLMIVLKKFTPSGKKIEEKVKYPQQLDMKKYSSGHCGQTSFNLLSVIVHKGTKSTKGHYYTFTRRTKKDWFYFNDDCVKESDIQEVLGRDAYIMVYQKSK